MINNFFNLRSGNVGRAQLRVRFASPVRRFSLTGPKLRLGLSLVGWPPAQNAPNFKRGDDGALKLISRWPGEEAELLAISPA